MNNRGTRKTAIFVDGGYYRKRAIALWGKTSTGAERANELFRYCMMHIEKPEEPRDLYRIFYYDCPPMKREMTNPVTGEKIIFGSLPGSKWADGLYEELSRKRKVALRMGELAETQATYVLKPEVLKKLLTKEISVDDLKADDVRVDVKQKGVDMRIGLDAAAIAYGRYVDQIILIAGDSDFIPVAKMARRNGIDFILDPMKQNIKPKLSEHLDGIESFTEYMYKEE